MREREIETRDTRERLGRDKSFPNIHLKLGCRREIEKEIWAQLNHILFN